MVAGTLPTAEQSALTSIKDAEAQTVNRTMDTFKGTLQTSVVLTSNATASAQDYYFTKFVSDALVSVSSITADNWVYAFSAKQSNAAANFPCDGADKPLYLNVYVWRPSTGAVVGTMLDGNTASVYAEPGGTTQVSEYGSFAASAVAGVQDGDVIVAEIWFRVTQGGANARTDTFYFDGTVETNFLIAAASDHASYIGTWQALTFTHIAQGSGADTLGFADSVLAQLTPGAGNNDEVSTKKGTITLDASNTAPHDQQFTGVGFVPKALIVFGTATVNESYGEGMSITYGMSDGTTNGAIGSAVLDGTSTTNGCIRRNDACICILDPANVTTELVRGVVKTLDTDGFTITWNVKNTTQYILHYIAIGGTDITNVKVKHETAGTTSTGNKAYTGTGFKPDAMITASTLATVAINTASSNPAQLTIGACAYGDPTTSWTQLFQQGAAGTTCSLFSPGLLETKDNNFTLQLQARPVTFDVDGYTLNHTTAPSASTNAWFYLAIKGGYWKSGVITQKTSAGTQIVSWTTQADPEMLFLASVTTANANNEQSCTSNSIGACDNTSEGCMSYGSPSNAVVMVSLTTAILREFTPNATAASSTLLSEADINDMATLGQFTLDWTTADATARQIGYLVLMKGSAGGAAPSDQMSGGPARAINLSKYIRMDLGNEMMLSVNQPHGIIIPLRRPWQHPNLGYWADKFASIVRVAFGHLRRKMIRQDKRNIVAI